MNIGFDISQTGQGKAGCGFFAYGLIRGLAAIDSENEYILYPTFGDFYFDRLMPAFCPIHKENFRYGLRHVLYEKAQEFWRNPPHDYEAKLGSPDIIHANNFFCPSKIKSARVVYTLHDLGFIENPDWSTELNRTSCFNGVFNASLYADGIVAVSEYSRNHFLDTFPYYPAERVTVVYPASRFEAKEHLARPKNLYKLKSEKFWLSVGTLEPRKNHLRLLKAYAKLKAEYCQMWPLVLAGGSGWLMDDLQDHVNSLGLGEDVIVTGYVDDNALQWLYQNCYASLYPSLFEGFGLPVLEAMTLGAPVITSNTTSIPEVAGDAALLVDPVQVEDIYQAMRKLVRDEVGRERLKEQGLNRATRFSWNTAAKEMLVLYKEVVAQPKRLVDPT